MLPRLAFVDGPLEGQVLELGAEPLTVGRGTGNRITLPDPSVSRQHCIIEAADGGYRVRDLSSHNGTFLNGLPVGERCLADGDELKVGRSVFRFLVTDPASPPPEGSARFTTDAGARATMLLRPAESVYLKPQEALAPAASLADAIHGYQALLRITGAFERIAAVEELAGGLLEALFEAVPAESGAVLLLEDSRGEPAAVCTHSRSAGRGADVDVSRTVIERVRREGVAVLGGRCDPEGGRCAISSPLLDRERLIGMIYLEAGGGPAAFDEATLQLVAAAGLMAGPVFAGAQDFESLQIENQRLAEEIRVRHEMVGESPRMQELYRLIGRVAPADSTALILGETGTGKELVARAIHDNSARSKRPFVAINSAALTESLLESELFGHERGAFTGAVSQKKGKLELAHGGTLFLDEIGELPQAIQAKLLRVLQQREFERVGGTRPISVDIRLIAATNRNLREQVDKGMFRQDLYYRLNVVTLRLPPLRERREDIPLLASFFLSRCAERSNRRIAGISGDARKCLSEYDWPGNVRELQNAIESAAVLGTSELILPEDLPEAVWESVAAGQESRGGYHAALQQRKSELILEALSKTGGNITEAARLLELHPNYLHRLIRNLGLRDRIAREPCR